MTTLITVLLPIVVTLGLGFFAGWHKDFTQGQSTILNRVVMLYSLPMSLAAGILSIDRSELFENVPTFIGLFIVMIGGYFLCLFIFRYIFKNSIGVSALRALAIAGPAVPFVGPTVLGTMFGASDSALVVSIGSILMNLIQVPITLVLLSLGNQQSQSSFSKIIKDAVKEPVVWSPIISFLLVLIGFQLPSDISGSLTLLGTATGGVALFASGIVLYAQKVSISKDVIVNVLAKSILIPLITFLITWGLKDSLHTIEITTLTMAIPTASIPVILAVEYKTYEKEAASTLFFSTLISIITMGILIFLIG